jgi:RNA polymerase sigma factor (sigma-70 family)
LLTILTQAQMVEKLGSSSAALFAELYEEYLPKVYRYIIYRVSDVPTAEDLTSVVFEKALTNFNSYDKRKAQFSTWVFTIARNTLTDYYRKHHNQATVTLEDPAVETLITPSPEAESERAEDAQHLQQCLTRLTAQEQEIIALKFGAEMTNRGIAAQLSLTESNVAVIVFRAVRKLRDDFRGNSNG